MQTKITEEYLRENGWEQEEDYGYFWFFTHSDLNVAFSLGFTCVDRHEGYIGDEKDGVLWPHDIVCVEQLESIIKALTGGW